MSNGHTVSSDSNQCTLTPTKGEAKHSVDFNINAGVGFFNLSGYMMTIFKGATLLIDGYSIGRVWHGKRSEAIEVSADRKLTATCSESDDGCSIEVSASGCSTDPQKDGPLTIWIKKCDVTTNGAKADVDVVMETSLEYGVETKVKITKKGSEESTKDFELHAEINVPKIGKGGDSVKKEKKEADATTETIEYVLPGEVYRKDLTGSFGWQCGKAKLTVKPVVEVPKTIEKKPLDKDPSSAKPMPND